MIFVFQMQFNMVVLLDKLVELVELVKQTLD